MPVTGKPTRKKKADLKVGTKVKMQWYDRVLSGVIIEDRGHLGAQRQQVVRVCFNGGPDSTFDLEVPVDWVWVKAPRVKVPSRRKKR